jgi:hypothetical protein
MSKCRITATVTVPIEIEWDIEDESIEHHGSTIDAIKAATEEACNIHMIFSDIFGRGRVRAVENVEVDFWDFD